MVDVLLVTAGIVLLTLMVITTYAATEYYKQLRKAKKEFERARDIVEDVVISFNRELKRESERLSSVSYEAEGASVQAETGLRRIAAIEERVFPLGVQVNNLSLEISELTSTVGAITEFNAKILEKVSGFDTNEIKTTIQCIDSSNERIVQVDSKVEELQSNQEILTKKIAVIEEQVQKQFAASDHGADRTVPMPVMPIKREKALATLTDTEVAALEFLTYEGPKTAPEIKERVHLSREHTARLMKKLYEEGYLERETGKLPFRYSVKKEMENLLKKPEPPTNQ